MECSYCKKLYSNIYTLKTHQKTTRSCLLLQNQQNIKIDKKSFDCSFCLKEFTTKKRYDYHLTICKVKINKDQLEIKTEIGQLSNELKEEVKRKDEQIQKLTEQLKQLQQTPTIITNNNTNHNTIHNHVTIFNYMTPERVAEIFQKHYTVDTLLGGQKALANFFVDHFVLGEGKMVYICVDRSRKKICYTTDFVNFKEDTNCETAVKLLGPCFPVIKSLVEWTEFEKKYNPVQGEIHESFDEILAVRSDGSIFQTQLSRRLPSSLEDKEQMDKNQDDLQTLDELRALEEKDFVVRKEEIDRIIERSQQDKKPKPEAEPVERTIAGVRLGKLDDLRKLYKREGTYKIHRDVNEQVESDPVIAQAYEDYIKRGMFQGIQIWE